MIIIMLGAPGTGKGTVAGMIEKGIGIKQVSTGDIFRKNMQEGTELGKLAESYISKGQLVPDEVTIKIVKDRLEEKNKKIDMVLNLVTPEEEIIERIVNRRICSNPECKTIYNLVMNKPKQEGICDKCGSELIQRKDDNEETVKARIKSYMEQTSPLVEYYEKKGVLKTEEVTKQNNHLGKEVAEEIIEEVKK